MVSFTAASILAIAAAVSAQTTAGPGYNGALASCKSSYTVCTSSNTPVDTCKSQLTTCETTCKTKYDDCRVKSGSNKAQCASDYSTCLGRNPFDADGNLNDGLTTTAYQTVTVASYTTICPAATTWYENGQKYAGNAGETVTVLNCPCTRTIPVANAPTGTPGSPGSPGTPVTNYGGKNNVTGTYTPVKYTGGASVIGAGFGALAGAAGILAFAL